MFSFFKKNKSAQAVPQWASFFNDEQYAAFIEAVEEYFYAKNVTYTLDDGLIEAGPNDFGFGKQGLVNVAQVCNLDKIKNYKAIVTEHFEAQVRGHQFDKEFKQTIGDYEQIKDYLAVRLYPNDYADAVGRDLTIGRDFGDSIYQMLVFDLPDTIESIRPDQAEQWGKTTDELFEVGIENVKKKYPLQLSKQETGIFEVFFAQGEHFFVPNIVFDQDKLEEISGSKGMLIGLPHRHVALMFAIENIHVVEVLTLFINTVNGMFKEGPGSVSNSVFWYHDGVFTNLPYTIEDETVQFTPPDEFIELLDSLEESEGE